MSISVMSAVWANSKSTGSARLVLLAIADFADDSGRAYPSVNTLAKKAAISERTAQYSIRELITLGELTVGENDGPRGCNVYRVQCLQGAENAGVQDGTQGGAKRDMQGCKMEHRGVQTIAPEPSENHQRTINEPSLFEIPPDANAVTPEQIYEAYPRKVARLDAIKAITKAIKTHGGSKVLAATQSYALAVAGKEKQFIPHGATWFNGKRYEEDPETWQHESKPEKGAAAWA